MARLSTIGLLLAGVLLPAQVPNDDSIALCGGHLSTGMERDEVMRDISAACDAKPFSTSVDPQQRLWHLYIRTRPGGEVGTLLFTGDKLTVASKTWARDSQVSDLLDAIFSAAGTVTAQSGHSCTVVSSYKDEPGESMKRVTLSCGHKQVEISFARTKRAETWSVTEDLREAPTTVEKQFY